MRIIAGRFRSRRLKSPVGLSVRPTPDRLRESLFSILAPRLEGSHFVDAYAGSGSVGLEAASRGAVHVTLIERAPVAMEVLKENVKSLGLTPAEVTVLRGSAARNLAAVRADIVFLDPPYDKEGEYGLAFGAITGQPLVIAQHSVKLLLPESFGDFTRMRQLRQGDNLLSFYEVKLIPSFFSSSV